MAQLADDNELQKLVVEEEVAVSEKKEDENKPYFVPADGAGLVPEREWEKLEKGGEDGEVN